MVERVLEFAGLSSGTTSRASGDVDVRNVIDDAVAALAVDARDRDIAVNVTGRGSLPIVQGDAAALRSAVQNILGNAIKYSPSGSKVGVDATSDAGAVRITVSDQGLGIDAADLPHVFKPFFRGRRAVDAQLRGTGVGLSVVRHVVDAHGGHVRINSAAGVGTVVTLTLPITAGESSVVAQPRTAT
jgi:two-component system sensor histidine kinase SenX3